MKKEKNIIFRVNEDLKTKVEQICKDEGYTLSAVLNASLLDIAERNSIPINIKSKANSIIVKPNTLTIPFIKESLNKIINSTYKEKIKKVYLFGSYARGEEKFNSDVDLRIDNISMSYFDIGNLRHELKEILHKDVDIVLTSGASNDFLEIIKNDEICIYESR